MRTASLTRSLFVAGLLVAGAAAPVRAAAPAQPTDEQLKRLSLEELGNIVVTSVTKQPEAVWATPAAIYVLTHDDIVRSGATSLPEVLRLVPGVQVSRLDADHWAVGVRGFANQFSQSLLVLIDGRSVYTPLFAGVYWSVQDIVLEDVDRIEVIRGPGGTIWGSNAVNGVINVITKSAKDTHGVLAKVSAGSLDHAIGVFRYGGSRGDEDALDYRVSGKFAQRGGLEHPGYDAFDRWHLGQIDARLDWKSQRRDAVTVDARWYTGTEGKLVGIGSYSPPVQTTIDGPEDVSGGHIRALWRRALGPDRTLQTQVYYDRTNRHGVQLGELRDTYDADFLAHFALPGKQTLEWGAGARWSPSTFLQTIPTADFDPHHDTDRLFSLFGQDAIAFGPRMTLTAGSKFEHNDYTGWETQPSARLLWRPTAFQSAWVAASRAVRIPSRIDRDLSLTGFVSDGAVPTFLRIVGTRTFDAERLVAYEAGYRRLLSDRLYVDVGVFHDRYRGLEGIGNLSIFPEADPAPAHLLIEVPYVNAIDGTADGFEVAPSWTPARWWAIKAGYSYLRLHLHNVPGVEETASVAAEAGSSPQHQLFLQSSITAARFDLEQTVRTASALAGQHVPAYGTVDLRAGWQVQPSLSLALTGQNLLGGDHVEFSSSAGLVAIGPSVLATVTWRR
ncbi:MAG TPA: TonB-dependent receptor [Vicinamibacterales bacterium]|nr:TonB-dependent receptor [Vicinamibacterales bacterium]